jgi:hypothetical protein
LAVKDLRASFDHTGDSYVEMEVLKELYRIWTEEAADVILKAAVSDMVIVKKKVKSHLLH